MLLGLILLAQVVLQPGTYIVPQCAATSTATATATISIPTSTATPIATPTPSSMPITQATILVPFTGLSVYTVAEQQARLAPQQSGARWTVDLTQTAAVNVYIDGVQVPNVVNGIINPNHIPWTFLYRLGGQVIPGTGAQQTLSWNMDGSIATSQYGNMPQSAWVKAGPHVFQFVAYNDASAIIATVIQGVTVSP